MEIRKLRKNDNFEEVAKLIYLTDPYIYPYWFNNNIEEGMQVLSEMIKMPTIFNYKNCLVALKEDKIIGLVVYATNKSDNSCLQELKKYNLNYEYTITNYVEPLNNYIKPNYVYISNVCVLPENRRHKVGTHLMNYLIKNNSNKVLNLHVLKNNVLAIKLYKKFNFQKIENLKGFSGYRKRKPEILFMERKKTI